MLFFELTRVFRSLPQYGEKNLFIQKLVLSKIKETLVKIETCSTPEIETLMNMINETAPNQLHVGASCSNERNQVFTVIGFSEKSFQQAKQKPQDIDLDLYFDLSSSKRNVYGLFYDPNSPER